MMQRCVMTSEEEERQPDGLSSRDSSMMMSLLVLLVITYVAREKNSRHYWMMECFRDVRCSSLTGRLLSCSTLLLWI